MVLGIAVETVIYNPGVSVVEVGRVLTSLPPLGVYVTKGTGLYILHPEIQEWFGSKNHKIKF